MISGFGIIRNGIERGYPFVESILSVIHEMDEFVILDGHSTDGTWEVLVKLASINKKLVPFRHAWMKQGDRHILAYLTDIAKEKCRGNWLFYVQSDEIWHPDSVRRIKSVLEDPTVYYEAWGVSTNFLHLTTNFQEVHLGAGYVRAFRVIRNEPFITSMNDAWNFNIEERAASMDLPHPIVHADRVFYENVNAKVRAHREENQLEHGFYVDDISPIWQETTCPYMGHLPVYCHGLVGMTRYVVRDELYDLFEDGNAQTSL